MNGFGAQLSGITPQQKWLRINQLMRDDRIAVLALQETHLTEQRARDLETLFESSLQIHISPDEESPTAARGVAIVLNKKLIRCELTTCATIIPGRAMEIVIPWGSEDNLHILAVYAPNRPAENRDFWTSIHQKYEDRRHSPDLLLGDMNFVESALDRVPMHSDQSDTVTAARTFFRRHNLIDGWRLTHGEDKDFSFHQRATGSLSRIDRAYIAKPLSRMSNEWTIDITGIPTDHKLISLTLSHYNAPFVGNGRWSIPHLLLQDKIFIEEAQNLGRACQRRLDDMERDGVSFAPQKALIQYKDDLLAMARRRAKSAKPKLVKKRDAIKAAIHQAKRDQSQIHENEISQDITALEDELANIESRLFENKRQAVMAHDFLEGETISKYWSRVNAPPKQDSTIYELETDGSGEGHSVYTRNSTVMANVACEFYDNLQHDPFPPSYTFTISVPYTFPRLLPRHT